MFVAIPFFTSLTEHVYQLRRNLHKSEDNCLSLIKRKDDCPARLYKKTVFCNVERSGRVPFFQMIYDLTLF